MGRYYHRPNRGKALSWSIEALKNGILESRKSNPKENDA
jgi:hypothetical protein